MLLLDNEQTELTAIEKGKHAYEHIDGFDSKGGRGKTGGISEYAEKHNQKRKNVELWLQGYKVIDKVGTRFQVLGNMHGSMDLMTILLFYIGKRLMK